MEEPREVNRVGSKRVLTLFDCICIIVGTIIGAGIFQFPGVVASHLPSLPWFLAVWVCGGLIAFIGALCFAELTTNDPQPGGDYAYLKQAYHPGLGFAFSWAAFWVIRPGNIGALAMIFGNFGVTLLHQVNGPTGKFSPLGLGVAIVGGLTALNLLGVVFSKSVQNILTTSKVLGILIVIGGAATLAARDRDGRIWESSSGYANAMSVVQTDRDELASAAGLESSPLPANALNRPVTEAEPPQVAAGGTQGTQGTRGTRGTQGWGSFWLAMVFVMFTFGGWSDIAFVASEVKNPQRNLLLSLVLGTFAVLVIYLMVNLSLLLGLGLNELASFGTGSNNPTAVFVERTMGSIGAAVFSALVCLSCLGGINAMIFTSPRIYWATAQDYPALVALTGSASNRNGWWRAMVLQAVVTMLFLFAFAKRDGGIDTLVAATAPYFWLFLGLTVLSIMINRRRMKTIAIEGDDRSRVSGKQRSGFRVPGYPVTPLIFVAACLAMMIQAWQYLLEEDLGWWALGIGGWVMCGVGLSAWLRRESLF